MAYPTVAEIKAHLTINDSITADDAMLTTIRAAAIAFIEGPAGAERLFEVSEDSTRRFDYLSAAQRGPINGQVLYVDRDLCAVTTVTNGDGTVVPSTGYRLRPRNDPPYHAIELLASQGYVWQPGSEPVDAIAIIGRWGYSTEAPADVAQACLDLAAHLYRRRTGGGEQDRPIVGDGFVVKPADVPSGVMRIVRAYRRHAGAR